MSGTTPWSKEEMVVVGREGAERRKERERVLRCAVIEDVRICSQPIAVPWRFPWKRPRTQSFASCRQRSLSGSSSTNRAASWPTLGML